MPDQQTDQSFCQDQLRKLDPLRHFMALAAPEEHRPALMVFYAFLNEINRIPLQVSEPSMGEIRLQWWMDIVAAKAGKTGQGCGQANIGPLATCFKQVQERYALPQDLLLQFIEAHKFDLYNDPMPDWETFETLAGESLALPLLMAAQILNDGIRPNEAELCGNAAMALALTKYLTAFAHHAKQQKLYLPLIDFTARNIALPQIWAQNPQAELIEALQNFEKKAIDRKQQAYLELAGLKEKGQSHLGLAFLELSLINPRLKRWKSNPLAPKPLPLWRQYWSIWRSDFKS